MITLYWSPQSSATRVLWMLEELQEPYQIEAIDIRAEPRRDPPDFLAASPMGKVPALRDGEERLSGSAPICLYLADRYAAGRLAPRPDEAGRCRFLQWMFYSPAAIEPAMMEKFMGLEPNKVAAPWGTWDLMLDVLENRLAESHWIAGDAFSAADVMIGSSCYFLKSFNLVAPTPVMSTYIDRCSARPAYQRALARDTRRSAPSQDLVR